MNDGFLKKWFLNPDYQSGVEFYLRNGTNSALKKLFQAGPTAFSKAKLRSELLAMMKPGIEVPVKPIQAPTFRPVPDWHIDMQDKKVMWMKERDALRGQLTVFKTNEERKTAAFRIIELCEQIYEASMDQNEFRETGRIPIKVQPQKGYKWEKMNDIELMEYFYNSLKPKLARNKGNQERFEELKAEDHAIRIEIEKRRNHGTV